MWNRPYKCFWQECNDRKTTSLFSFSQRAEVREIRFLLESYRWKIMLSRLPLLIHEKSGLSHSRTVQAKCDSVEVCVCISEREKEKKSLRVCLCVSLSPALCKWSWLGCMASGLNLIYELCSNTCIKNIRLTICWHSSHWPLGNRANVSNSSLSGMLLT